MPNLHLTTALVWTVHFMQSNKNLLKYNNILDFVIYVMDRKGTSLMKTSLLIREYDALRSYNKCVDYSKLFNI